MTFAQQAAYWDRRAAAARQRANKANYPSAKRSAEKEMLAAIRAEGIAKSLRAGDSNPEGPWDDSVKLRVARVIA